MTANASSHAKGKASSDTGASLTIETNPLFAEGLAVTEVLDMSTQ